MRARILAALLLSSCFGGTSPSGQDSASRDFFSAPGLIRLTPLGPMVAPDPDASGDDHRHERGQEVCNTDQAGCKRCVAKCTFRGCNYVFPPSVVCPQKWPDECLAGNHDLGPESCGRWDDMGGCKVRQCNRTCRRQACQTTETRIDQDPPGCYY